LRNCTLVLFVPRLTHQRYLHHLSHPDRDGENGLTYEHRSVAALQAALQRGLDDTEALRRLGERGYLFSEDGNVRAFAFVPPKILNYICGFAC
jgi:hypothetical protein